MNTDIPSFLHLYQPSTITMNKLLLSVSLLPSSFIPSMCNVLERISNTYQYHHYYCHYHFEHHL